MDLALAFVPEWRYCRQPYLALPTLAGHLKRRGHTVRCLDLNLGFLRCLAGEGIHTLHRLAREVLEEEGGLPAARRDVAGGTTSRAVRLAWVAAADPRWLARRTASALELLRQPAAMSDVAGHRAATITLDRLWDAARAVVLPSSGGLSPTSPDYQEPSLGATLEAVASPRNPFRPFLEREAERIAAGRPAMVGISAAATVQLIPALTLAAALRRCYTGPVVLGGNLIIRLLGRGPALSGLLTHCDALLYGEGEVSLEGVMQRLGQGRDMAGAPGTVTRRAGRLIVGRPAAALEPADLPLPDFGDMPPEDYLAAEPHLPLLAGRGCYWRKCSFCAHHAGYRRHVTRPAEAVADDMQALSDRHGVSTFTFEDDDLSPSFLQRLATVLGSRDSEIHWGCYVRLERRFRAGLARRLAAAGCRYLFFGLESACQHTLDRMNKGVRVADAPAILESCRRAGIFVQLSLQFGYPGETAAQAAETLRFVEDHHHLLDSVSCQPFRLEECSPLARDPESHGVSLVEAPDEELSLYRRFTSAAGRLDREELADLTHRLTQIVVSATPSLVLNRVPAYYAYFHSREELVRWVAAADRRERVNIAALVMGLRQAEVAADTVWRTTGDGVVAFDWRTGTATIAGTEAARALAGDIPPGWRVPVTHAHLFRPRKGGV